jgi:4-amino-4-deoxy-L-arabinose transferase-like glycosyltransferase
MCKKWTWGIPCILLTIFSLLLVENIFQNSPVQSEDAHLISGISHHYFWNFDLYRVNPPLVRTVATAPVAAFCTINPCWDKKVSYPLIRSEHPLGVEYAKANIEHATTHIRIARITCILFALIGGIVCYVYSLRLYGFLCGITALALWCSSPFILGHAATIMPDAHVASLAVVAVLYFWWWLKQPDYFRVSYAGIALGVALLTKFTLLIFYPLFIILWLMYRIPEYRTFKLADWFSQAKQIFVMFAISLLVINMGYLFEGTGKRLGDFRFQTTLFSGVETLKDVPSGGGNRFKDSLLGYVPMPLTANMIQGIDTQRLDFERTMPSYLRGEWSDRGWWYYYLYALLIKTPLGTLGLLLLAIYCTFFIRQCNASWRDEMIILIPGIVFLAAVSSQTGFSHHSRYIIPALPFFFIWISKIGKAISWKRPILSIIAITLLLWSVSSSLWVYPHSISYFNALAGKVTNYPYHLLNSNIDWGQDLFFLERWCKANPDVTEIRVAVWGSYPLESTAIPSTGMPPSNAPQPGWYAVSVNYIYDQSEQYRYFLNFEPVAMAGYSIWIYHLTQEDVDEYDGRCE